MDMTIKVTFGIGEALEDLMDELEALGGMPLIIDDTERGTTGEITLTLRSQKV